MKKVTPKLDLDSTYKNNWRKFMGHWAARTLHIIIEKTDAKFCLMDLQSQLGLANHELAECIEILQNVGLAEVCDGKIWSINASPDSFLLEKDSREWELVDGNHRKIGLEILRRFSSHQGGIGLNYFLKTKYDQMVEAILIFMNKIKSLDEEEFSSEEANLLPYSLSLSIMPLKDLEKPGNLYDPKELLPVFVELRDAARSTIHDIKSPISALKFIFHSLGKEKDERIELAKNSLERLEAITEEMSQLLKKYNAQQTSQMSDLGSHNTSLNETALVVKELLDEYRYCFIEQNIDFILKNNCHLGKNLYLKLSRTEINRIISNIVDNSIQSIKRNGSVTVILDSTPLMFTLTIADTGPGVSNDSTSDRITGMGLGLGQSYVKSKVSKANGESTFERLKDGGYKVKMFLPLNCFK